MTPGQERDTPIGVEEKGSQPQLEASIGGDSLKTRRKEVRRSLAQDAVNIPNMLTFGRIVMIPLCL